MRSLYFILPVLLLNSLTPVAAANFSARIIGGQTASSTEWPWMTALEYQGQAAGNGLFCGGTLIAPNWVLTAAHCMHDENGQLEAINSFQAVINTANLNSLLSETHSIAEIHVHPHFNQSNLNNDLALIKLSSSSKITPIELLPAYSNQDTGGQNGIALGWGNISTYKHVYPKTLQQVSLPIIGNAACNMAMSTIIDTGIIDSMLCAGASTGGYDTCDGDSGGPLLVFDQESQSWRQAGITSFGQPRCAARGSYGVYTRIDSFSDFISDTICTTAQKPAAPALTLTVDNTLVTADWTPTPNTTHYRLNYAAYPYTAGDAIYSLEMNQNTQLSVNLAQGSAYYVAITAYSGNCKSGYSNIEQFSVR